MTMCRAARVAALVVGIHAVVVCTFADDTAGDLESLEASIDGPPPPSAPEVMSRDGDGRVTLRAVRLRDPLRVDGRLEESVYRTIPSIEGFVQQEPLEGAPATESTEAWIFFDAENVYVAARCWDSEPDRLVANELRRDNRNIFNNENFAVIFDTFYDRRNGFLFHTNPLGALYDAQVTDEGNTNSDWNTVWDVKTARFAEGWTVEMAIPFKSLRYKPGPSQIWGVNFRRIIRWKNEWSYLTPVPAAYRQGGLTKLSRAGTLVGIEPPSGSMNLELKPYATGSVRTDLDADVPFENDVDPDVGFDVKYGMSKSLVADFTVNTDFAQVEADDEQVNLTRFNLFLPEKREFFLEGQGIFGFGGGSAGRGGGGARDVPILFFSRRIGLAEDGRVPIRAGGRLTGRAGSYTLGLVNIQSGGVEDIAVEPTNFTVMRLKRDVFRRSSVGVLATHRSRAVESGGSNSVFGLDAGFSFYENLNVDAYWARSRTEDRTGDEQSYMAQIRYGSDRYGFNVSHLYVGDDFNPEIGFVRREDIRKTSGRLRFSPRPLSIRAIRKFSYTADFEYYETGDGRPETRKLDLEFQTEFASGDELSFAYEQNFEQLFEEFEIDDDVSIAPGGYGFDRARASYRLGPQRRLSGRFQIEAGEFFSGTRSEVGYWGRFELTPRLSFEPNVSRNWIDLEEGAFTTTLLRLRSTYAVSSRSFLGALVQYNTSSDTLSTNLRYRWEYQPGSDFFVVYTDSRDTLGVGFPEMRNHSFVVKFTRLFRF